MKSLNLIVLAFSLVLISCGSSGSSSILITATNNELLLSLNSDGLSIEESGTANIIIETNFPAATTDTLSFTATFNVSYGTTTADDFSTTAGNTRKITKNITISADTGNISFVLPISVADDLSILDDNALEDDETFDLRLTSFEVSSDLFPATTTIDPAKNSITITIENDDRVTLSITPSTLSVSEGSGTIDFTVSFTGESAIAIPFSYSVTASGDNPVAADDFIGDAFPSSTGSLTVGSTTTTINIAINDDDLVEDAETFLFSLTANGDTTTFPYNFIDFGTTTATVDIEDNDIANLAITTPSRYITESESSNFVVTLDKATQIELTATYTVKGTGDNPATTTDFTTDGTIKTVIFPANSTAGTPQPFTLETVDDNATNDNKEFVLQFSTTSDSLTGDNSAIFVIVDDDNEGVILLAEQTVAEGAAIDLAFLVNQSAFAGGTTTVTVDYKIELAGDATATVEDFTNLITTGTVVLTTAEPQQTITIATAADEIIEANQTFSVVITKTTPESVFGNTLASNKSRAITIIDDDKATLTLVRDSGNEIAEGVADSTTDATFTVSLASEQTTEIDLIFTITVGGTGDNPTTTTDFKDTSPTKSITITTVDNTTTFSIIVAGDAALEYDEQFTFTASGANFGSLVISGDVFTIENDDRVTLSVTAVATSVNEAGGNVDFTVSFTGDSEIAIPFSYSVTATGDKPVNADDFGGAFPSGTGSLTVGSTSTTITIVINDDELEETESFLFSLTASDNEFLTSFIDFGTPTAAVNIENDDRVTLSITTSTSPVSEVSGTIDFTVSLVGNFASPISFNYSVSASGANPVDADDFGGTFPSGTDSLTIGDTTTISIAIDNDDELELPETFLFSLTASGDAATFPNSFIDFDTTTATIESEERITISGLTASTNSIAENGGATTITFTADRVAPIDVEITYSLTGTATLTEDYTIQTNSVTIVTGTSTTSVTITAVDDNKAENDETIVLMITGANLVNTTTAQTITITIDDDDLNDNDNNNLFDLTTVADFTKLRLSLAVNYELLNDLDLAGNTNFEPIGEFTGIFDGNGFSIKNLTINIGGTNNVGLFSRLNGATVRNLIIENPQITGNDYVGALAGRATNSTIDNVGVLNTNSSSFINGNLYVGGLVGETTNSTINNSWATGSVVGTVFVGGLVGRNRNNSTISNSWASGSVVVGGVGIEVVGGLVGLNFTDSTINNSWASGSVVGNKAVGGLAGRNSTNATISNSWASGSVVGSGNQIGGLVGHNLVNSTINNSWAAGSVVGNTDVGGLVGFNITAIISDSYWNTETSGQTTSSGSTTDIFGVTTEQMITATGAAGETAFNDWNSITDIPWSFRENTEYPTISSNVASADFQLVYQVAGQLRLIPAADTAGTGGDFFGDSSLQDELSATAADFTAGNTLAIFDLNARAGNTDNTRDDFAACNNGIPTAVGENLLTTNGVNGTTVTVTIAAGTTNPANWSATTACEIVIGTQPIATDELNLTVEITKAAATATRQFKITFVAE